MGKSKKVLILSYYWPPSGGSGVQRWMYFAKYLKQLGWEPIVITVDEKQAAYPVLDESLLTEVNEIRVIKTSTREPLRLYSRLTSKSSRAGIPQAEVNTSTLFGKIAAYIRGNFFIPDARRGWVPFATKAASEIIAAEKIQQLITTGPPHSTHLVGLALSKKHALNWWVDFRDPWTSIFYNRQLYRSQRTEKKDLELETTVLQAASGVITTVGGELIESLKTKTPNQNFVVLPNGYDEELFKTVEVIKVAYFHIVYTGLLTRNQPYLAVLNALKKLAVNRPIRFSLAGNISSKIIDEIKTALPKIDVVYHGYLEHAATVRLMKSADLLLNFIFEGAQSEMISGKLLEYFATAVPVLSLGDPLSAAGKFIAQGSCARMIEPDQENEIFLFLEELYLANDQYKNIFPELKDWSRKAITKGLISKVLE